MLTPRADSGVNAFDRAASSGCARNTADAAPVTATRTPPSARRATNTPTSAKRDAGFGNLTYAALAGTGNATEVMISSGASDVSYIPVKNRSAGMDRAFVCTVAPSASTAAGQSAAGSLL